VKCPSRISFTIILIFCYREVFIGKKTDVLNRLHPTHVADGWKRRRAVLENVANATKG
jgi:hypothetical protein